MELREDSGKIYIYYDSNLSKMQNSNGDAKYSSGDFTSSDKGISIKRTKKNERERREQRPRDRKSERQE